MPTFPVLTIIESQVIIILSPKNGFKRIMSQTSTNGNFWSNQPLHRHDAKSMRENGISYLVDCRGNRLPSFTSIIEATKTAEEKAKKKAKLANWRCDVGSTEATRISCTAKQRGKIGHRHLEKYFNGEKVLCPELIKPHWEHLMPVLEDIHDIKLVESYVFHYYEGFAGRLDCVASYRGTPCIIEFKFPDRFKPIYEETPLQLSAYCGAVNRQYGLRIQHTLVIQATPNQAVVRLFAPDEVIKYWGRWQQRVAQFWNYQKAA